jgi:hypothetical protein
VAEEEAAILQNETQRAALEQVMRARLHAAEAQVSREDVDEDGHRLQRARKAMDAIMHKVKPIMAAASAAKPLPGSQLDVNETRKYALHGLTALGTTYDRVQHDQREFNASVASTHEYLSAADVTLAIAQEAVANVTGSNASAVPLNATQVNSFNSTLPLGAAQQQKAVKLAGDLITHTTATMKNAVYKLGDPALQPLPDAKQVNASKAIGAHGIQIWRHTRVEQISKPKDVTNDEPNPSDRGAGDAAAEVAEGAASSPAPDPQPTYAATSTDSPRVTGRTSEAETLKDADAVLKSLSQPAAAGAPAAGSSEVDEEFFEDPEVSELLETPLLAPDQPAMQEIATDAVKNAFRGF